MSLSNADQNHNAQSFIRLHWILWKWNMIFWQDFERGTDEVLGSYRNTDKQTGGLLDSNVFNGIIDKHYVWWYFSFALIHISTHHPSCVFFCIFWIDGKHTSSHSYTRLHEASSVVPALLAHWLMELSHHWPNLFDASGKLVCNDESTSVFEKLEHYLKHAKP